MDLVMVEWDVLEDMWKRGMEGEQEGKVSQQATSNGLGGAQGQNGKR